MAPELLKQLGISDGYASDEALGAQMKLLNKVLTSQTGRDKPIENIANIIQLIGAYDSAPQKDIALLDNIVGELISQDSNGLEHYIQQGSRSSTNSEKVLTQRALAQIVQRQIRSDDENVPDVVYRVLKSLSDKKEGALLLLKLMDKGTGQNNDMEALTLKHFLGQKATKLPSFLAFAQKAPEAFIKHVDTNVFKKLIAEEELEPIVAVALQTNLDLLKSLPRNFVEKVNVPFLKLLFDQQNNKAEFKQMLNLMAQTYVDFNSDYQQYMQANKVLKSVQYAANLWTQKHSRRESPFSSPAPAAMFRDLVKFNTGDNIAVLQKRLEMIFQQDMLDTLANKGSPEAIHMATKIVNGEYPSALFTNADSKSLLYDVVANVPDENQQEAKTWVKQNKASIIDALKNRSDIPNYSHPLLGNHFWTHFKLRRYLMS